MLSRFSALRTWTTSRLGDRSRDVPSAEGEAAPASRPLTNFRATGSSHCGWAAAGPPRRGLGTAHALLERVGRRRNRHRHPSAVGGRGHRLGGPGRSRSRASRADLLGGGRLAHPTLPGQRAQPGQRGRARRARRRARRDDGRPRPAASNAVAGRAPNQSRVVSRHRCPASDRRQRQRAEHGRTTPGRGEPRPRRRRAGPSGGWSRPPASTHAPAPSTRPPPGHRPARLQQATADGSRPRPAAPERLLAPAQPVRDQVCTPRPPRSRRRPGCSAPRH